MIALVNMPFESIQLNEYPSTVYTATIKEENDSVSSVEIIGFVYSPSHGYFGRREGRGTCSFQGWVEREEVNKVYPCKIIN